jgi:hypothetical protein
MRSLQVLLITACSATVHGAEPADIDALLTNYCLDCHDRDVAKADVDLSGFAGPMAFLEDRRIWQRAAEVVAAGEMPPEKKPQPTEAEREQLTRWIRSSLDDVDWEAVRSPGRVPPARLTRAEYEYSVKDLLGVSVALHSILPEDPGGLSGFVNDRSSLVMTRRQLEGYLKAAERVAANVVDNAFEEKVTIRYEVEEGENANWQRKPRTQKDGSVGWILKAALGQKYQSVSHPIDFPRTGTYRVRVRAKSEGPGPSAGLWIALDSVNDASREAGVLVTSRDPAIYETEIFVTRGRHELIFGYDFYRPLWLPPVPDRPQIKLGQSTFHPPPYDQASMLPEGVTMDDLANHGLRVEPSDEDHARTLIKTLNQGYFPAVLDRLKLNQFHYEKGYLPVFVGGLSYDYTENVKPAFAELATLLDSEESALEKIWKDHEPASFSELEKVLELQKSAWSTQDKSRKAEVGDLFVDWIELEPVATAAIALPTNAMGVTAFLEDLLPRAFRTPVKDAKIDGFLELYQAERQAGVSHRQAVERTLTAVLVSPDFLFRRDGPAERPGIQPIDAWATASRLAAFLWSSLPDRTLQEATRKGELSVDAQVDRMLDDPRSLRLAKGFTEQWLALAGIGHSKEPDKELFRYFSWHLAEDMRAEVALLFDRILRENRSVLELLDAPESFLNERLARLYGIDGVQGQSLRPVALKDPRRGGLLGTAAVLTTTSLATRTSPVRRGQFVLETLLGVELPPPPADVPDLSEEAGQRVLGASCTRSRVCRLPQPHRSPGICLGELRLDGPLARARPGRSGGHLGPATRRAADSWH